uniref:2-methoxy-6-polyprenyl-1,4-benzoquinol methylase, mitochondrial n=1 Tax=Aureoumbra lagunensis TaxID=44058 RepID=A0A7S3JWZ7_9STRA|mmetsp:Transcript_1568/g.2085  ORF Transcript_1568/g.2085 Transcript_1568/m.2085 type:complete len:276 (+) Transcript_1568:175-1002(+)|eukprot:CAMPEP_0197287772 /NCGR_PEP_ID=MMETSP0890-20130614/4460_1 /TAXON_ID=44058 ORGANISM="Aureoumbra lagunensis, Strain CCMP1510" /NCGR_SAMPLE_ID=MMETSP0890 /ASSEMBLY_ACC=CAM_ASM_000533 /LENGTH=275 /DNA_ID=CAMNT_0042757853 /DNA_START=173 /DNA_END=1000 /DNA_ORIENTATION=-
MAKRSLSIRLSIFVILLGILLYWFGKPNEENRDDDLGHGSMFDRIAGRYDRTNRVMSLGMDKGWRRVLVRALDLKANDNVLDLATGTADVAILEAHAGAGKVLGIDPSANMISIGREKLVHESVQDRVSLELGDATQLDTLTNKSFDKISIAFGIRNIPNIPQALIEMRRVAKPKAILAILEFCEPESGPLAPIARFFIRFIVPRIGALLSGAHWNEYRHLQASIAAFPSPSKFAHIINQAGFHVYEIRLLAFGSVALYLASPLNSTNSMMMTSS